LVLPWPMLSFSAGATKTLVGVPNWPPKEHARAGVRRDKGLDAVCLAVRPPRRPAETERVTADVEMTIAKRRAVVVVRQGVKAWGTQTGQMPPTAGQAASRSSSILQRHGR
jgi:hypothetical protein